MAKRKSEETLELEQMVDDIKARLDGLRGEKVQRLYVEKAILAIYRYQTEDEKRTDETRHDNSVGFSSPDARVMSYCAKWLMQNPNNHLNEKFYPKALKIMPKYATQLAKIAIGKRKVQGAA